MILILILLQLILYKPLYEFINQNDPHKQKDMRNIFFIILLILTTIISTSCQNSKNEEESLTKENAMSFFRELSPERGAFFYAQNRTKYTFLDSFYTDSIFPAVALCSYQELKKVTYSLKSTPLQDITDEYFKEVKSQYLQDIQVEIREYAQLQKQLFETEIYPLMEIELDSMLNADITKIIDRYAGGFLNYRKLEFFIGKDSKKFEKLWKEYINPQSYNDHINKYIQAYMDSISEFQKQYFYDVTGRKIEKKLEISVPEISMNISSDILKQVDYFTSGEKVTMTTELIKDYATPIAVGLATGGIGTLIYEVGNTAYDIHQIYKDIENQKIEPEEQLLSVCIEELNKNIEETCLQEYKLKVLERIESSNEILFNLITLGI